MRALPLAILGLLCACQPTQSEASRPAGITLPTLPPQNVGDPICGPGWQWDGSHCLHVETAAAPATGGVTASLPAPTGLETTDVVIGTGAEAHPGDLVAVQYVGSLANGTEFDASSKHGGTPFEFRIGDGKVIKGLERGVVGMKVGGKRRITIPPDLAYGKRGIPPVIPPNATLVFQIDMVSVKK